MRLLIDIIKITYDIRDKDFVEPNLISSFLKKAAQELGEMFLSTLDYIIDKFHISTEKKNVIEKNPINAFFTPHSRSLLVLINKIGYIFSSLNYHILTDVALKSSLMDLLIRFFEQIVKSGFNKPATLPMNVIKLTNLLKNPEFIDSIFLDADEALEISKTFFEKVPDISNEILDYTHFNNHQIGRRKREIYNFNFF